MASIASVIGSGADTSTNPTSSNASGSSPSTEGIANETTFLQLLVAQIKNQDPLNPSDGTQFIAQLAQFEQLEQSINTGQDIAYMRQDVSNLLKVLSPQS